ncbi:ABC transporter permease [Litoreibacter roseus]|uniref:ABC transporter permease n=1 Tax=Litoreibacter roseus TaxID=2601869 RepID=UPI001FAA67D7|nr:ABC transporter permease [Litoreibacter roseus]
MTIGAILAFLYVPIAVLVLFSFNTSRSLSWPMEGLTLDWYRKLAGNEQLIEAVGNSFYVATCSTILTLVIGVPAALALDRLSFSGKGAFRKLVLLPIALPGIITGISMLILFRMVGFTLSLETVIIGHATALLAVVVTQVYARLQRLPRSYEEASADLGASGLQTFFFVTLPNIRSAVIGAGLLSFTLSFDEIPVTFFLTGRDNTLPMYIWSTMRRGLTPEINAVGALIVAFSAVLIVLSVILMRDKPGAR